jgi:hypothetical protein
MVKKKREEEKAKVTNNQVNVEELIKKIKDALPPELKDKCKFEEIEDWLTIKPEGYLGTDIFTKLRTIVVTNGGEYCGAGKQSHFRIRVKAPEKAEMTLKEWYAQEKAAKDEAVAKQGPLAAYVAVNLNFNVAKASEVGPIFDEIKKHVRAN